MRDRSLSESVTSFLSTPPVVFSGLQQRHDERDSGRAIAEPGAPGRAAAPTRCRRRAVFERDVQRQVRPVVAAVGPVGRETGVEPARLRTFAADGEPVVEPAAPRAVQRGHRTGAADHRVAPGVEADRAARRRRRSAGNSLDRDAASRPSRRRRSRAAATSPADASARASGRAGSAAAPRRNGRRRRRRRSAARGDVVIRRSCGDGDRLEHRDPAFRFVADLDRERRERLARVATPRAESGFWRSARLRNSRGDSCAYAENACENDDRLL